MKSDHGGSGTTVLEARDVTKTYREGPHEVQVLRRVSLSLCRGEVVTLEGPSGSGKTTLLCVLGCLLGAEGGRLTIEGREVDVRQPMHRPVSATIALQRIAESRSDSERPTRMDVGDIGSVCRRSMTPVMTSVARPTAVPGADMVRFRTRTPAMTKSL